MKKETTVKAKKRKPAKKRPILSTAEREAVITEAVKSGGLRLAWIKFIDAYIGNGGNGTKAYMEAYPDSSEEAARRSASDLLTKPDILDEINNKLETQKVTEDKITSMLIEKAGYSDSFRINASVKALEVLAKMKGLLVDTKRIAFTGDNPAVFVAPYSTEEAKKIDEATKSSRIIE